MDSRINGNSIESSNIPLNSHVEGITANKIDEINAIFLLYHVSAILYTRKVSATASIPIMIRGT